MPETVIYGESLMCCGLFRIKNLKQFLFTKVGQLKTLVIAGTPLVSISCY